jgi:wyosine [tRNA(Phe)-imidazoG37] synthetase (radical SAM superfamily)
VRKGKNINKGEKMERRIYGPVPSRRLGRSLGVNNIPYKICTYQCIYCQVGKAIKMQVNRQEFYNTKELVEEVKMVLSKIKDINQYPDYITIVPDGEPTLDIHLGELITQLKTLNVSVAVITNGSLLYLPDVQQELLPADYVSVKADSFNAETWREINLPHRKLKIHDIMGGMLSFSQKFTGRLVSETMLVSGVNDSSDELEHTALFLKKVQPAVAYIAIPTRPPAYKNVIPAPETKVNEAYHIFKKYIPDVELLTGYEGNAFSSTGDFREDIMSITAVHPMREDAVMELLHQTGTHEKELDLLIEEKLIEKLYFNEHAYYLRKFRR